jgi:hypothetical protein
MDEPITAENKKQNGQKPPLSVGSIAGAILAGGGVGFAVALLLAWVAAPLFRSATVTELTVFLRVFLIVHVLCSAIAVYFFRRRSKETGSFPATIGGGILGGVVMLGMLFGSVSFSGVLTAGAEKIIFWPFCVLLLLTPPAVATLGFNLTRRYKGPPSS